jgi:hypothetical protein
MTTYIYHEGTGTIIDASECVLVDVPQVTLDTLTGDDFFDDEVVAGLASDIGRPINTTDLTFGNCVAYSPSAIRQEVRENLSYNDAIDETVLAWALRATDDQLNAVASYILNSSANVWDSYIEDLVDGLIEFYRRDTNTEPF